MLKEVWFDVEFMGFDVVGWQGWVVGCLEKVYCGMLYLDGIDWLSFVLQVCLLVLIEGVEFWFMGVVVLCLLDLCVIVLIGVDLEWLVCDGVLWVDLYYWLLGVVLYLLVLVDWCEDVLDLFCYFIFEVGVWLKVYVLLMNFVIWVCFSSYDWSGNLCELCQFVEVYVLGLFVFDIVFEDDLVQGLFQMVQDYEFGLICEVLWLVGGNVICVMEWL